MTILAFGLSACAHKAAETKAELNKAANSSVTLDTTLPWLQAKIWEYQSRPVSSPARSVVKTTFEGKVVYYVPPVCCDIPSELYGEDGKLMCYPSGGFTGAGDGGVLGLNWSIWTILKIIKLSLFGKTKENPLSLRSRRGLFLI